MHIVEGSIVLDDTTVTQFPPVVEEVVGSNISINCVLEGLTSYCYMVAWMRTPRWPGMLRISKNTDIIPRSENEIFKKICPVTIQNATVTDSGIYYCAVVYGQQFYLGNGTTVIVKDKTKATPTIQILSSSDSDGSSVPLLCISVRSGPISEEWDRGAECTCVVEFERHNITKTAQNVELGVLCYITVWIYRLLGITGWLLLFILIVTLASCRTNRVSDIRRYNN
ncbi:hypothetical protein UPYG_G00337870 [Umbra pygmaea]|uniref:Ig-like domain-containing protein n=1 Tax=Umbra pygmaea TaxID=75934 RepID=A0ABD0W0Q4_UMBPY